MEQANTTTDKRFAFGRNWQQFLAVLNEDRIRIAEDSLKDMLGLETLNGKRFVDVGSGSGLFSLAARRLGAQIHSFDYDPQSVACTLTLKERYFPDDPQWRVEQGSALDADYLASLGKFDIVYSWGVLHHTGAMWTAIDLTAGLTAHDGLLFIAIYNDQGWRSKFWRQVKATYCSGVVQQKVITFVFMPYFVGGSFVKNLLRGKFMNPFSLRQASARRRGMSPYYDVIDWLGGYPFEVAHPEQIVDFCQKRGFDPQRIDTVGHKSGCNQFVFRKR